LGLKGQEALGEREAWEEGGAGKKGHLKGKEEGTPGGGKY